MRIVSIRSQGAKEVWQIELPENLGFLDYIQRGRYFMRFINDIRTHCPCSQLHDCYHCMDTVQIRMPNWRVRDLHTFKTHYLTILDSVT